MATFFMRGSDLDGSRPAAQRLGFAFRFVSFRFSSQFRLGRETTRDGDGRATGGSSATAQQEAQQRRAHGAYHRRPFPNLTLT